MGVRVAFQDPAEEGLIEGAIHPAPRMTLSKTSGVSRPCVRASALRNRAPRSPFDRKLLSKLHRVTGAGRPRVNDPTGETFEYRPHALYRLTPRPPTITSSVPAAASAGVRLSGHRQA